MHLNFGEHYYEAIASSFWTSVLIAFVGAFLGLLAALFVNRLFERRGNLRNRKSKEKQDLERLQYLILIMDSVIDTARNQIRSYQDLAKSIRGNFLQTQMPILIASNDIWRLKNLDSIALFDSYASIFSDNNNAENYKNIFAKADFVFERMNDALKQNERHRNFHYKDELFVRDCIEDIYIRIGLSIKDLKQEYGNKVNEIQEYVYLREFEKIYSGLWETEEGFIKFRDEYLKPLHNTIFDNIQDRNFANSLFGIVKKALSRLRHIEFNASEFAKSMENLENDMNGTLVSLENSKNEIGNKMEFTDL